MQENNLNCKVRRRISYTEIMTALTNSDSFKNKISNLTIGINNDGSNQIITDKEGNRITNLKLSSIYYFIKSDLGINLTYIDFIDILKTLLFKELDEETLELLENEEISKSTNIPFLNGREEEIANSLNSIEETYLRTETICEIIKAHLGLDISIHDNRLPTFLKDLGYRKIRKRIEGKQLRVWVK